MNRSIYHLMNWPDIEGLVYSECSNPHELLGAHLCKEGMLVQVFRPDAVEVVIHVAGRKKAYPCEKVDESGYFAVLIPLKKLTAYTVTIEDVKGHKEQYIDAYACDTGLTEEQLKRIAAGDDYEGYRSLGAHEMTVNGISGVNFAVWAPEAVRVSVVGAFNHWDGRILPMKKHAESGIFELFVPEMKAGTAYKYEIKFKGGSLAVKTDPYCQSCDAKQNFVSVIYTEKPFAWEDTAWQTAVLKKDDSAGPMSICEINPEECADLREPEAFAERICEQGYTHVELMAAAEYGGNGHNLYETVAYFAPAGVFGEPEDLKRLINALHKKKIGVLIDWNAAFMSNAATGLTWFDGRGLYESSTVRLGKRPQLNVSTFNYSRRQVRSFLIANAVMWAKEYHVDGLRVDELASALYLDYGRNPGEWIPNLYGGNENLDAVAFFQELRKQLTAQGLPTLLIAEDSSTWGKVTGDGEEALGFDFKWNYGWQNDFLSFMEQDSLFRKGVYHKLTDNMLYYYSENFLLEFSHKVFEKHTMPDRMPGTTDWEKKANMRLAYGYQYFYPGKKLINDIQVQQMNPKYIKALNTFYKQHSALYEQDYVPEGFVWVDTANADETVLAFARKAEKEPEELLIVANFTPVVREDFRLGVHQQGKYTEVFNSDAPEFGGQGVGNGKTLLSEKIRANDWEDSVMMTLPPLSVTVYAYQPYSALELEEIRIRQEAVLAERAAEAEAAKAEELREKAEEEARAALEAEKRAKQAAQAALEAKLEAEKQAEEAEAVKQKIAEETKKKLAALKRKK